MNKKKSNKSENMRDKEDYIVFFDTNFLIQCKDLDQIDFSELFGDFNSIELLLAEPVLKEIDNFKTDPNRRRSKRARKYNSIFLEIHDSEDNLYPIYSDPSVVLKLAPFYNHTDLVNIDSSLDILNPDDMLLAYMLKYRADNQGKIYLLTYDTTVLIKAQIRELDRHHIPTSWLLPASKDQDQKQKEALKNRIIELEKKHPDIQINCFLEGTNGRLTEKPVVKLFPSLTSEETDYLINKLKNKFPMKMNFSEELHIAEKFDEPNYAKFLLGTIQQMHVAQTKKRIDNYINVDYPEWIEKLNKWLSKIHFHLYNKHNVLKLFVNLENTGNVFANDLRLELSLLNGCEFIPKSFLVFDYNVTLSMPKCPNSPSGRYTKSPLDFLNSSLPPLYNFPSMQQQTYRNKYELCNEYKHDNLENKLVFTCDEFRHHAETKSLSFDVLLPGIYNYSEIKQKHKITARNIPVAIEGINAFEIEIERCKTIDYVKEIIEKQTQAIP